MLTLYYLIRTNKSNQANKQTSKQASKQTNKQEQTNKQTRTSKINIYTINMNYVHIFYTFLRAVEAPRRPRPCAERPPRAFRLPARSFLASSRTWLVCLFACLFVWLFACLFDCLIVCLFCVFVCVQRELAATITGAKCTMSAQRKH